MDYASSQSHTLDFHMWTNGGTCRLCFPLNLSVQTVVEERGEILTVCSLRHVFVCVARSIQFRSKCRSLSDSCRPGELREKAFWVLKLLWPSLRRRPTYLTVSYRRIKHDYWKILILSRCKDHCQILCGYVYTCTRRHCSLLQVPQYFLYSSQLLYCTVYWPFLSKWVAYPPTLSMSSSMKPLKQKSIKAKAQGKVAVEQVFSHFGAFPFEAALNGSLICCQSCAKSESSFNFPFQTELWGLEVHLRTSFSHYHTVHAICLRDTTAEVDVAD